MTEDRFVAYYRVSTAAQGRSGLGLDAQREAVRTFLNGAKRKLLSEHTEVESGKLDNRPELAKALNTCRLTGATLIIAKLDRLSRDAAFLLNLEKAGVEFLAADMPNANRLTVRLMAVIAQSADRMVELVRGDAAALQGGQTLALPDIPNYDVFSPAQPVQSALLILRAEARNAGADAPDWVASLQCTMQGTDNQTLAYQLGYLIGGAVGKERSKAPI